MKNKLIIFMFGLIFLVFSCLQINDPDSYLWITAYLLPALLSFASILNYSNKYFQYLSPIYLIIAVYLYFNNNETMVMHILSETTNESLGLVLCSIWIYILPLFNNQSINES